MAVLRLFPLLQVLYQLEEFMVEQDEAFDDANRLPYFLGVLRVESHAYGRLRSPFKHVLALFIEAGRDGVSFLECDQQGRQWRTVVVTLFDEIAR
jgi:hypothetical protein